MTREEFIKDARSLGYEEDVIREIVADCEDIEGFDYGMLPLFEQPKGDI